MDGSVKSVSASPSHRHAIGSASSSGPGSALSSADARRLARALSSSGDSGDDIAPGNDYPARIAAMRIIRRLGAGGMGEVFEAEQTAPRRRVAIKLLRPDLPLAAAGALEREIEILGRLEHPGIARIYTAGTACVDGLDRPWFAMELIDGLPITDYALRQRLTLPARIDLIRSACLAVQYAHDLGVIHLDLNPANVMVDRSGRVRVLDFGISRLLDDAGPWIRAGAPGFAAPEQFSGAAISARADIYGLGALLGALVTLHRAEAGARHPAPDQLAAILARATAHEPAQRYQTPREMAEDLARFLAFRPVRARRATASARARLLMRRRCGSLLAAGAAVTLTTLGAGLWHTEARRAAEADRALAISQSQQRLAEEVARSEAEAARQSQREARSQAVLAQFAAGMIDLFGEFEGLGIQPGSAPRIHATPGESGETLRVTITHGDLPDKAHMSELIRLQSALLQDPHDEELNRRWRQLAAQVVGARATTTQDAPGVTSRTFSYSGRTHAVFGEPPPDGE